MIKRFSICSRTILLALVMIADLCPIAITNRPEGGYLCFGSFVFDRHY